MLKKIMKIIGAGMLAFLLFTSSTIAYAEVQPRYTVCEANETTHNAPNCGAIVTCYSQLRKTGSTYSFEGKSMTATRGSWKSDKNIYIFAANTGTVRFVGTLQLNSANDYFSVYHYQ